MSALVDRTRRAVTFPASALRALVPRLHGMSVRSRRITVVVLSGLILLGVAGTVVLGLLVHHSATSEQTRAEILDVAKRDVEQLLSYRASDLDADLARSRALIAPEFADEFDRLSTQLITPATRQNQLQTVATALRSGVISAGPDRAEVLVFLRQMTTRGDQPPTPTSSRANVTMARVDGQWLVAGLEPA